MALNPGFEVSFKLTNDEAKQMGTEQAIANYLRKVADRVENDMIWSGRVMDGNGNEIGTFGVKGKIVTLRDES